MRFYGAFWIRATFNFETIRFFANECQFWRLSPRFGWHRTPRFNVASWSRQAPGAEFTERGIFLLFFLLGEDHHIDS